MADGGLLRAGAHLPGRGEGASDVITLGYDDRYRRRMRLVSDGGLEFLLDLPQATELREGDALELEDGRRIAVRAADEPVADLTARDAHHLVRLAWHLGNRHLPTQILGPVGGQIPSDAPPKLRIRQDHVIEAMAEGLGAAVARLSAPFNPEGGAYGQGRTHGHSHGHAHDHSHKHGDAE